MFTAKSNIFCSGISIYLLILGINTSWYDFKRQWLKFYINLKYCLAICILFSCELYVTMSVCIYNERQLILQPFCKQVGMLIGYKELWSSASFGTILCHDIWLNATIMKKHFILNKHFTVSCVTCLFMYNVNFNERFCHGK